MVRRPSATLKWRQLGKHRLTCGLSAPPARATIDAFGPAGRRRHVPRPTAGPPLARNHGSRIGGRRFTRAGGHDVAHQVHRDVRRRAPDRAGRHDVGRAGRARRGRGQRGRPRFHHRAHPAHPGRSAPGDRTHPRAHRQAVRGERDDPALDQPAAVRGVCAGDHRVRREDRGDRGQQSGTVPARLPAGRDQGAAQVHQRPARAQGTADRRGRRIHRRLRMRRTPGRGRCAGPDPDPRRRKGFGDPDRRLGRYRRCPRSGRRAGAGRGRGEHGDPLPVHAGVRGAPEGQGTDRRPHRAEHSAHLPHHAQHRAGGGQRDQPQGRGDREGRREIRGRARPGRRCPRPPRLRGGRSGRGHLVRRTGAGPDRGHSHLRGADHPHGRRGAGPDQLPARRRWSAEFRAGRAQVFR